MASGNGDLSGLTDEVTDGPVETGKVWKSLTDYLRKLLQLFRA